MDPISTEALNGLATAIQSLMPAPADPNLKPSISVRALSIAPSGIGGVVGLHHEPDGDIVGRRIEAIVVVGLRAQADAADAAVSGAINAILAADRAALVNQGLLRVAVDKIGDRTAGQGTLVEQDVGFRVLYEFLKKPVDPGDIIREIPLNIQLQQ
jgi:hypothetical protein